MSDFSLLMTSVGGLLAGLKGPPTFLNVFGVAAAALGIVAQKLGANGLGRHAQLWPAVRVTAVDVEAWLEPFAVDKDGEWTAYSFRGRDVLRHANSREWVHVSGDAAGFVRDLAAHVWSSCDDYVETKAVRGLYDITALVPAVRMPSHPSARADALWERLRVFGNEARSVLVDGPPGVGKSTVVRNLADRVGGRLLRIPASEVDTASPTGLAAIVTLLRPDVIVIDDFDRAWGQTRLLDFFEQARLTFRLLVVTTNSLEHVDPAITRPGRFDEVVTFDRLGDDVVAEVLGPTWAALDNPTRERVCAWPIAYLVELRKRHERIDGVDLASEVADLDRRVHRRVVPAWAQLLAQSPGLAKSAETR